MKKLTLLLLLACGPAFAQDLKISQLTSGSPAQAADMIPIARAGANFRLAGSDFCLIGGCTMTAPILQAAGSSAAPSYSFSAETDMGCYRDGADQMTCSTGASGARGTLALGGNSALLAYNAGGTGTWFAANGTAQTLDLVAGGTVRWTTSTTANTSIGVPLYVGAATADQLRIVNLGAGAGAFSGTITSADLTAARTWTLPNVTGNVTLEPSTTGFFVLTGAGAQPAARSFTSGDGSVTITNAAGQAGNVDLVVDTAVFSRYQSGTASVPATGAVGTFYFETDRPAAYTYPATDAETVLLSLPAGTGTSGGVPYFTATADVIASSAVLTANLPVIGGGAGAAPSVGTRSGSTTAYVTTTGTQTSGDCVKIDANGNHIANGSACGGAAAFDPSTSVSWYEDFISGTSSAGSIGDLGLVALASGGGTFSQAFDSTASHPGIFRNASHVSADNSGAELIVGNSTPARHIDYGSNHNWTLDSVVTIGSNGTAITNTALYFGVVITHSTIPSDITQGIWIRRDTDRSDTAFVFQFCNASGAAGCAAAGDDTNSKVTVSTITPTAGNSYRLRIRRSTTEGPGSTALFGFRVNDETEVTFCSSGCSDTILTAIAYHPVSGYWTRTTTGVMSADIDYIAGAITGLTRY